MLKFLNNTCVDWLERAGTSIILHAVKVGVLNASNQRQSMYCHKLKLTEASFSRKCINLNKSDVIFKGCN